VDMSKVIGALGFHTERVTEPAEIIPALRRALDVNTSGRPAYIEFICCQYPVYGQWVGRGQRNDAEADPRPRLFEQALLGHRQSKPARLAALRCLRQAAIPAAAGLPGLQLGRQSDVERGRGKRPYRDLHRDRGWPPQPAHARSAL